MDTNLPKTLQITLDNLLMDNTLRSWTVQGNTNITTVIIRFKMDVHMTNMEQVKYKKVPKSQMKRDMSRSDNWRKGAHQETLDTSKEVMVNNAKKSTNTPVINNTISPCPAKVNTVLCHSPPHANTRSRSKLSATAIAFTPSPVPQVVWATDTVDVVSDLKHVKLLSDKSVGQYESLQTQTGDIMQQLLSFRELYLASKHDIESSDDEASVT